MLDRMCTVRSVRSLRALRGVGGTSIVASVAVVLAACGGSDASSDADPVDTTTTTVLASAGAGTEPTATEPPVTEPPATEPPATEPPVTEPPATDPPATEPAGDDGSCLIGDWVLTEEEMNAFYDALAVGAGGGRFEIDTTGTVRLSFTEDTYRYVGDFSLDLAVAGQVAQGDATGTAEGTWTASDGVLRTELTSSDLDVVVTVNGVTIDGGELTNGILRDDPLQNSPFSCDGPTILFQSGATEDVRHPVVLTPA